ncbi:MAG TPA: hypothetical protein VHO70_07750 [Chitinispirillaceae bacterium]|nr:hypothetical protein [Chitinispirillaceae bacterium]
MKFNQVGLLVIVAIAFIWADSKLSGRIHDMILVVEENPYVITDNVIVPAGKKLVISSGCVLLFKPFTGISVEGELEVKGTAEKPVVFTSENDTRYNSASSQFPNPFDWNGIIIDQSAGSIQLSNFSIKYSVYGLKSYKEDIVINDGVFGNNGQSNLTVFETMKNVPDGIPYSYRLEPRLSRKVLSSDNPDNANAQVIQNESNKKNVSIYKIGTYGCAGAGLVCLGITTYFVSRVIANQNNYLSSTTASDIDLYKSMRNSSAIYATVSAVPTLLFAGGTLFFIKKSTGEEKGQQHVSLIPSAGEYSGVVLTIKF